jgi:heat shock protein HslJ
MKCSISISLIVVALVVSGLGCCCKSPPASAIGAPPIENLTWQLATVDSMPAAPGVADAPAASFLLDSSDKHVTGNTGLNDFNGGYELSGNALKFGPVAMTRKAGPERLMQQEAAFSLALTNTASWRYFGGNTIDLLDAGGVPLARFTRGPASDTKGDKKESP